jgi:hypothetical protein
MDNGRLPTAHNDAQRYGIDRHAMEQAIQSLEGDEPFEVEFPRPIRLSDGGRAKAWLEVS